MNFWRNDVKGIGNKMEFLHYLVTREILASFFSSFLKLTYFGYTVLVGWVLCPALCLQGDLSYFLVVVDQGSCKPLFVPQKVAVTAQVILCWIKEHL